MKANARVRRPQHAARRLLSLTLSLLVVAPLAPSGTYAARQDETMSEAASAPKTDAAALLQLDVPPIGSPIRWAKRGLG